MNDKPLLYLASPYTHSDPAIRQRRFDAATKTAAELIRRGHIVYSPITMTHPIDLVLAGTANTLGSDYWVDFDIAFMDRCDAIAVLPIDGWQRSAGVRKEIQYFRNQAKPVWVITESIELEPYHDAW